MKVSIQDIRKKVSKKGGRFYTLKRDNVTVFVVNGREYTERELISEYKEGYLIEE